MFLLFGLRSPRPATGVSRALRARSVSGSLLESVPENGGVGDRPVGGGGVSRSGVQESKIYELSSEPKEHKSFCPGTRPGRPVSGVTQNHERKKHPKKICIKNFGGTLAGGSRRGLRRPNSLCRCWFSQQNTVHKEFRGGGV